MINYLLVAIGSALGGVMRFWTANHLERRFGPSFPWGTLCVNVVGSFLIGLFAAVAAKQSSALHPIAARNFLLTGVMGGFTTFSAFSLQTLQLLQLGRHTHALLNVAGSLALCLLGVWLGHLAGQAINR